MNTSARYSFAAGIALACGAFTLTAMSAAPATAPTPEPTAMVAAPTASAQYAPAEAPAPVVVPAEGRTDTVYVPETGRVVQEISGEVIDCADGEAMAEDGSCVPANYWDDEPTETHPTYTLPACQYEDSQNCYWDAAAMGNGTGTSFINLNGVTYYPEGN